MRGSGVVRRPLQKDLKLSTSLRGWQIAVSRFDTRNPSSNSTYQASAGAKVFAQKTTALGLGLMFIQAAWADPASDACVALADARSALYLMINAKDVSTQDALNAKVRAASTKLESALVDMTGPKGKAAADFKAVWDQFKSTRDKEIIPAIYKGNAAEAKKITDGIQYERLAKMWSIMSCR
jgi:hypothetical protein